MSAHALIDNAATVASSASGRAHTIARRMFDIAIAAIVLLLLLPLVVVVAVAIRWETAGPVLFRQRRLGERMKPFTVLKFRTMTPDADSTRHREYVEGMIGQAEPRSDAHGNLYKLAVDDRVTRVGRVLRGWSIDEVPQLWNVIRGDMSLVGPRPVIPYEAELYPESYLPRFAVKPGLTGLWQVSGRNERTYDEMVRFDVEYAERNSLRGDLLILLKTMAVVVRRRGVA